MANVGYATMQVIPSMQGMGAALTAGVSGPATAAGKTAGTKLGGSMLAGVKSFVGPMVAIAAGTAVFSWLKDAQKSASDLNETASMSAIIFGDQAGAIDKWASSAATSAGLSKAAALSAAAGFGDMFLQLGFAGAEAAKMSTSTVQLAADLGSFKNLPTEDVTQRIAAAFRGEYDSLQTLIPNINAARVQSEALAMTGKTVASELTAQEKAAAVLAIVNKDGARAAGDFARTSASNANQQKILAARYENVKTAVGRGLIPVMAGLLKVANFLLGVFVQTGKFVADNATAFKILAGVVAALTVAVIAQGVAQSIVAAGGFLAWIGKITGVTKVWTAVQWAMNAALNANPIALVVLGIAALVAGIIYAYKHSEKFRAIVDAAFKFVAAAVKVAWENVIKPAIDALVGAFNWVTTTAENLWTKVSGYWTSLSTATSEIWEEIKGFVSTAIDIVKTKITTTMTMIKGAWSLAWNSVKSFLSGVWDGIKSIASDAIDEVLGWIEGLLDRISDLKDAILGAGGGLLGGGLGSDFLDDFGAQQRGAGGRVAAPGGGSRVAGDQRRGSGASLTVIQHNPVAATDSDSLGWALDTFAALA